MDENKIVNVKALLYDADTDEVKRIISQTEDQEILYVYAYNYNWDNGFDIPQTVLDNKKSLRKESKVVQTKKQY